jgi:hypothetical protein
MRFRCNIECIRRAISLTHETSLTVFLAGDRRWLVGYGVKDVGRTHLDAQIAIDTEFMADKLNHDMLLLQL